MPSKPKNPKRVAAGRKSKRKGKLGERELAKLINTVAASHGLKGEACRGRQYKGTDDSPDVISELLTNYHIEVKRYKRVSVSQLDEWWAKLIAEAGKREPILFWREDYNIWKAKVSNGESVPATAALDFICGAIKRRATL